MAKYNPRAGWKLYEVLGLSWDAKEEQIRRAYKKKALEHHPDKNGDEEADLQEWLAFFREMQDEMEMDKSAFKAFMVEIIKEAWPEAEVIEQLWAAASPKQMYDYVKAAITRKEWPKALALLELEAGAAAARETDKYGKQLLHIIAARKGVPLAVLR